MSLKVCGWRELCQKFLCRFAVAFGSKWPLMCCVSNKLTWHKGGSDDCKMMNFFSHWCVQQGEDSRMFLYSVDNWKWRLGCLLTICMKRLTFDVLKRWNLISDKLCVCGQKSRAKLDKLFWPVVFLISWLLSHSVNCTGILPPPLVVVPDVPVKHNVKHSRCSKVSDAIILAS